MSVDVEKIVCFGGGTPDRDGARGEKPEEAGGAGSTKKKGGRRSLQDKKRKKGSFALPQTGWSSRRKGEDHDVVGGK